MMDKTDNQISRALIGYTRSFTILSPVIGWNLRPLPLHLRGGWITHSKRKGWSESRKSQCTLLVLENIFHFAVLMQRNEFRVAPRWFFNKRWNFDFFITEGGKHIRVIMIFMDIWTCTKILSDLIISLGYGWWRHRDCILEFYSV